MTHTIPEKRPQPVLNTAVIVAIVKALATECVTVGVLTPQYADKIGTIAVVVMNVAAPLWVTLGPLVTAFIARRKVTPKDAPKNDVGQDLVPVGSAAANIDVEATLAAADAICPAGTTVDVATADTGATAPALADPPLGTL